MKNYFGKLLQTFDYHSSIDFLQSLAPSHKYNLTVLGLMVSITSVPIEKIFGVSNMAFVALLVILVTELLSGIIASRIRKEQFSSMKLSRFSFKVAIYLVLIFVPNAFKTSFAEHDASIARWTFDWLHIFLITHIVYENTVSILENLSVITGNDKTAWINQITGFLNNIIKPGNANSNSNE